MDQHRKYLCILLLDVVVLPFFLPALSPQRKSEVGGPRVRALSGQGGVRELRRTSRAVCCLLAAGHCTTN